MGRGSACMEQTGTSRSCPSNRETRACPDARATAGGHPVLCRRRRTSLGRADDLVAHVDEARADRLDTEEAQGRLLARVAEEALAAAEHERKDGQPRLVDQVVLHERV